MKAAELQRMNSFLWSSFSYVAMTVHTQILDGVRNIVNVPSTLPDVCK